jgi:hypothetical protein
VVIVAGTYGRLANRLMLFAHLAASAVERGYSVWNPGFGPYASYFPAFAEDVFCRVPPRRSILPARSATRAAAYRAARGLAAAVDRTPIAGRGVEVVRLRGREAIDLGSPAFVEAARRRLVFVEGWVLRDHKAFEARGDELRELFRPAESHLSSAARAVSLARSGGDVVVGVHVRRGDYQVWEEGRYFWTLDRYAALMRAVSALFLGEEVSFLVCSDEQVSVADFSGLNVTLGPGTEIGDLYAFAGCDLLFGPPSTYTSWASFYGRVPLWMVSDPEEAPMREYFTVFSEGRSGAHAQSG